MVALLIVMPPRARRPVAIAGGAGAVVTALATMSAGWHRAGDSIAAFLLVGVWAGVAAVVAVLAPADAPARWPAPPARAADRGRWQRWMVAMTVGTLGVGFCLAFGLVLIRPLRTSTPGAVSAFIAGGVLIVAAAVAVLMAELLVLARTDP